MDLKIQLVKSFNWALVDIDNTDIESLLPFVNRLTATEKPKYGSNRKARSKQVYCDDPTASWL